MEAVFSDGQGYRFASLSGNIMYSTLDIKYINNIFDIIELMLFLAHDNGVVGKQVKILILRNYMLKCLLLNLKWSRKMNIVCPDPLP